MTRITRMTWTATTKVESACKVTDVVAISAMPPGANARTEVMSDIPVSLETITALTNIAAINPTEETNPTMIMRVTPANMLLYILEPIVAPRNTCDTWLACDGHHAVMSCPVTADPPTCTRAAPSMLPSSHGAGNFKNFAALQAPQAARIRTAVHKTEVSLISVVAVESVSAAALAGPSCFV